MRSIVQPKNQAKLRNYLVAYARQGDIFKHHQQEYKQFLVLLKQDISIHKFYFQSFI